MPVVPDASPLIVLGKLASSNLLSKLYGKVILTPLVWDEAVAKGKLMGARDAAYLEKCTQENQFEKARLTAAEKALARRLTVEIGLGRGEAEVLAVAKRRNVLAILDDKGARAVAVGLGISFTGTAGLLYESFIKSHIDFQELMDQLEKLSQIAWVSPALLAGILKRARDGDKK